MRKSARSAVFRGAILVFLFVSFVCFVVPVWGTEPTYWQDVRVGKSGDSPMIQLLLTPDTEKRMPLAASPVSEESVALLRRWIDSGAKEGQPPDDTAATTPKTTTPRGRKLDVLLTTNAVP